MMPPNAVLIWSWIAPHMGLNAIKPDTKLAHKKEKIFLFFEAVSASVAEYITPKKAPPLKFVSRKKSSFNFV